MIFSFSMFGWYEENIISRTCWYNLGKYSNTELELTRFFIWDPTLNLNLKMRSTLTRFDSQPRCKIWDSNSSLFGCLILLWRGYQLLNLTLEFKSGLDWYLRHSLLPYDSELDSQPRDSIGIGELRLGSGSKLGVMSWIGVRSWGWDYKKILKNIFLFYKEKLFFLKF